MGTSIRRFCRRVPHGSILEVAGVAWIVGAAFVVASKLVREKTSLPSGAASTTQVIGVVALVLSVVGTVWGLAALARHLGRDDDWIGAVILWSVVAGFLLLPILVGGYLLIPGLVALIARGRLSHVDVRLPAAAVLAGLVTAALAAGWAGGIEGPLHLNILSFLGATAEGAALNWFGRTTGSPGDGR